MSLGDGLIDQITTEDPEIDLTKIPADNGQIFVQDYHQINGMPVEPGDFIGYNQQGEMMVITGVGYTDQDYDRVAIDADKQFGSEYGLEFGAYLGEDSDGRDDTVSIDGFAGAVAHLDPDLVVGGVETPDGSYQAIVKN